MLLDWLILSLNITIFFRAYFPLHKSTFVFSLFPDNSKPWKKPIVNN